MQKIIVVGGGGHGKVIISLLKRISSYALLGYTDPKDQGDILGVRYLGDDSRLTSIKKEHSDCAAAIGVGGAVVSKVRCGIKQKLEALGYELPVIISPTAIIGEGVRVGKGTVILDGVVVNVSTRIGECAILNTRCSVDHDCNIGDFVHLTPGTVLCGGVTIGAYSILGAGSIVVPYKTIGESCLIGAGATVVDDCLESGVYFGTPARRKKNAFELV